MRFHCHLLPRACALVAMATVSLSAVDAPPLMTLTIGDGARLIKRFDASLYAKLWNDRSMEALRQKATEQLANIEKDSGINPLDVIHALRSFNVQFTQLLAPSLNANLAEPSLAAANNSKDKSSGFLQSDLGDYAHRVMELSLTANKTAERMTIPGADEAIRGATSNNSKDVFTLARYSSRLVMGINQEQPPSPYTISTDDADVVFTIDYKSLLNSIAKQETQPDQKAVFSALQGMDKFLGPLHWDMTILAEGVRERISQHNAYPGLMSVDRTVFAHLSAQTYMAYAFGFDSAAYWKELEPVLIDILAAKGTPMTSAQFKTQVEEIISQFNVPLTFTDIKQALTGTIVAAISPGAPFPSVTLAIPRSKAVDALIGVGANLRNFTLPEEGQSEQITIPNVPLPISVIRDQHYWVVSSDPMAVTAWSANDGGWSNSVAVKTVFAQAPDNAVMIGASDTPTVLRAAGGFLPFIPFADPKDKHLATVLLARAAGAASTGYIFGVSSSDQWSLEARGILGLGVMPILAGIALPALSKVRNMANDSAVVASLKSGVFPAQIQFQGGGYVDQNHDNVGEYGFFSELSGGPLDNRANGIRLNLLSATWNAAYPQVHGYTFACWLPDGVGGAVGANDGPRTANAIAGAEQQKGFVVYAWPTEPGPRKAVYALTQNGVIYFKPANEVELSVTGPAWNDLFNHMGWDAAPTWPPYKKK
jgi:hypothetical protein